MNKRSNKQTGPAGRILGRRRKKGGPLTKKDDNPGVALAATSEDLISDQDLAVERRDAIKRGKKHVIPLDLPIGRIMAWTSMFVFLMAILFTVYVWRSMYVTKSVNDFNYAIARVLPLPVAEVEGHTVSYESYLFELRVNGHFLLVQEQIDFVNDEAGKRIYDDLKVQSMRRAMVNKLTRVRANELGVTVIASEIDQELDDLVKELDESTIESTAKTHYGTDIGGIRRIIEDQLYRAKVGIELDEATKAKADDAVARARAGEDFAALATEVSDDFSTKDQGGLIEGLRRDSSDFSQDLRDTSFGLQAGEVSDPFVTWLQGGSRRPVYNIVKREAPIDQADPAVEVINIRIIQFDITQSAELFDSVLTSLITEGKASDRLGLTDPDRVAPVQAAPTQQ